MIVFRFALFLAAFFFAAVFFEAPRVFGMAPS